MAVLAHQDMPMVCRVLLFLRTTMNKKIYALSAMVALSVYVTANIIRSQNECLLLVPMAGHHSFKVLPMSRTRLCPKPYSRNLEQVIATLAQLTRLHHHVTIFHNSGARYHGLRSPSICAPPIIKICEQFCTCASNRTMLFTQNKKRMKKLALNLMVCARGSGL